METTETKTETKKLSLVDRIKQQTQTKSPGANPTPTFETKKEETVKQEPVSRISEAWNSKDDFEETEIVKTNTTNTTENKNNVAPEQKKLTHATKMASARTAVGMLDFTQKTILRPVVNYKFKKKFTKEQIQRIPQVEDANKATLSAEDQILRSIFDKEMKKRTKRMACIDMKPEEEKDLVQIFYNYFDVTETQLGPGYLLAMGITNFLGKRVIDIVLD